MVKRVSPHAEVTDDNHGNLAPLKCLFNKQTLLGLLCFCVGFVSRSHLFLTCLVSTIILEKNVDTGHFYKSYPDSKKKLRYDPNVTWYQQKRLKRDVAL